MAASVLLLVCADVSKINHHETFGESETKILRDYPLTYAPPEPSNPNVPMARIVHQKYTRLSALQWIMCYLWDMIFRTNYRSAVLQTEYSSSNELSQRERLSPLLYDTSFHQEGISFSKLSFCKVKDIRSGAHFLNETKSVVNVASEDVEIYQPILTKPYGMRGYVLMHRIQKGKSSERRVKRRIVIAFHASRNKANSRASCMIGTHKVDATLIGKNIEAEVPQLSRCHVYLGWYATFKSLEPQLSDALFGMIDFTGDGSISRDTSFDVLRSIDSILVTGPCMGGAIATLASVYIYNWLLDEAYAYVKVLVPDEASRAFHKSNLERIANRIFTYTFGSPRVGDESFARYYNSILGNNTYRIVNAGDGKVRLPLRSMGFVHCGQEAYFPRKARKKDGSELPIFSESDDLEDPSLGVSAWLWRAFIPVRPHIYFSNKNIMCCENT